MLIEVAAESPDPNAVEALRLYLEASGVAAAHVEFPGTPPRVLWYLDDAPGAETRETELEHSLAEALAPAVFTFSRRCLPDGEWQQAWKSFSLPVRAGRRLLIRPSWKNAGNPSEGDLVIVIDPGMAFGTGAHESTRLALALLEALSDARPPGAVLDLGTGSGVLAIAAEKLGAAKVLAVDIDGNAVRNARENAARNNAKRIRFARVDLLRGIRFTGNLLLANLDAGLLDRLLPQAADALPADGSLIASGILDVQGDRLCETARRAGFSLQERRNLDPWTAFRFQKGIGIRKV